MALGLVMTDWHTVGLLAGGNLAVTRPTYHNKGNQWEDLKANVGVEPRGAPSVGTPTWSILSCHQPDGCHAKDGRTRS